MPLDAEQTGGPKRVRRARPRAKAENEIQSAAETVTAPEVAPKVAPSVAPTPVAETAAPATAPFAWLTTGSVRYNDVTVILRQLIMLLEAGTPLLRSLATLAERSQTAAQRALVADIQQYVEMGNPLWQAFDRHPKLFDTVFVSLVKASEASGTLVPILKRLVAYRERREMMRKRIRAGMLYPAVLVIACFAVVLLIAKVIVPTFEDVFSKLNVELPAMTRVFMGVSKAMGDYWWIAVFVIAAFVAVYKLWYVQNPLRRMTADRIKLKLPVIGPILLKNAVVEFSRTLSLLLKSGMSMMSTLELVRNAIHNRAFAHTVQSMRDSVERGAGLELPLREAKDIIPPVVADMLVTGEETGRLDGIADQVADTYEEEVNIAIAAVSEALQPILTVIIGIMVVLLMLSVFVPLVTMVDQLGAGGA